jgi:hypothetical protein
MEGFDTMNDAPETIWVGSDICHDNFGPEPNIWKDEGSSYETDIKYTRSDIAQARIEKLQDAIDLGVIQGDVVAHLTVVSLTARTEELEAVLRGLLNCLDNRLIGISSAREAARTALKETP